MESLARSVVLGVAGRYGSGKSSLGTEVAKKLSWPYASFGGYVRSIAESRRLGDDRSDLQKLGEELLAADPLQFCLSVLAQCSWKKGDSLVFEGIRHRQVLPLIRQLTNPAKLVLVFVATASEVRIRRLLERGEYSSTDFLRFEQHSTEAEAPLLEGAADLVVDGSRKNSELSDEVVQFLQRNNR